MKIKKITAKEQLWISLKYKGFFKGYENYEEFRFCEEIKGEEKIEQIKKDKEKFFKLNNKGDDIEILKRNYNPCSLEEYCKRYGLNMAETFISKLIPKKSKEEIEQEKKENLELEEKNNREHLKFLRTKLKTKHDWEIYEGISGGVLNEEELKIKKLIHV